MRRGYATRQAAGVAAQCLVGVVVVQVRMPRRWSGGGLSFPERRARRKMEPAGRRGSGRFVVRECGAVCRSRVWELAVRSLLVQARSPPRVLRVSGPSRSGPWNPMRPRPPPEQRKPGVLLPSGAACAGREAGGPAPWDRAPAPESPSPRAPGRCTLLAH